MFDRALIIRKEWLDMIFEGIKPWELRSTHINARGVVGLIEAGSGLVMGTGNVVDSIGPLSSLAWRSNVDKHKVPYHGCEVLDMKWKFAWVLDQVTKFSTPLQYTHPEGAVIWVKFDKEYWK